MKVTQEEANVFLDLGMACGTYMMGELAAQGYPMTVAAGERLKRDKAMETHPDYGGSSAEFDRVQRAYEESLGA